MLWQKRRYPTFSRNRSILRVSRAPKHQARSECQRANWICCETGLHFSSCKDRCTKHYFMYCSYTFCEGNYSNFFSRTCFFSKRVNPIFAFWARLFPDHHKRADHATAAAFLHYTIQGHCFAARRPIVASSIQVNEPIWAACRHHRLSLNSSARHK